MSGRPPTQSRTRFDPANWPAGAWAPAAVLWLAYAGACLMLARPLFWTTLPIGILLAVRAEGYRWRVTATFVLPLALATLLGQAAMSWLDEPASFVGLVLWMAAVVIFSMTVIPTPVRDGWIARLPPSLVGEPFMTRLGGAQLQRSIEATNRLLGEVEGERDLHRCTGAARRLAAEARREGQRDGTWRGAWATHAAALEALADHLEAGWSDAGAREVNAHSVVANDAMRAAVERAKAVDPARILPRSGG